MARDPARAGVPTLRVTALRHHSTPRARSSEQGFTLVELMIVVMIIGLASAAVMWALPNPRGRLTDEATRFAARAQTARDLAIVTAQPVSLWVSRGGYGFDERVGGTWRAIGEKPLRVERWGAGTTATVGEARERVIFDSTGLPDHPTQIALARDGATAAITIAADGRASLAH